MELDPVPGGCISCREGVSRNGIRFSAKNRQKSRGQSRVLNNSTLTPVLLTALIVVKGQAGC